MAANDSDARAAPLSEEEAVAYAKRDLLTVAWKWLEGIRREQGFKSGAIAAAMMRVILAKGEEAEDGQDAIDVAIVNGRMLHGFPPRDEHEWAVAERIYEPFVVDDLKEWDPKGVFPLAPRRDAPAR